MHFMINNNAAASNNASLKTLFLKVIFTALGSLFAVLFFTQHSDANAFLNMMQVAYPHANGSDEDPKEGPISVERPYHCKLNSGNNRSEYAPLLTQTSISYNRFYENGLGTGTAYDYDDPRHMGNPEYPAQARRIYDFWRSNNTSAASPLAASISFIVTGIDNNTIAKASPELNTLILAANAQAVAVAVGPKFTCSTNGTAYNEGNCYNVYPNGTTLYVRYTDTYTQLPPQGAVTPLPPNGSNPRNLTPDSATNVLSVDQKATLDLAERLVRPYTGHPLSGSGLLRYTITSTYNAPYTTQSNDPYKSASLIEFDLPHQYTADEAKTSNGLPAFAYPNHCLELCATIRCMPDKWTNDTGTPSFPLQKITFEIFKFLEMTNPLNTDQTPAIKTIEVYPGDGQNMCYGYPGCVKYNSNESGVPNDCDGPANPWDCGSLCTGNTSAAGKVYGSYEACCRAEIQTKANSVTFCTSWDGTYNYDSEFPKTNGTFGFRAHVETEFSPPPIIADEPITVDQWAAFPSQNQIPIRVDVTNVHSVRATATVIGNVNKTPAQPYRIQYRLSKDSSVQMYVLDANHSDRSKFESTTTIPSFDFLKFENGSFDCKMDTTRSRFTVAPAGDNAVAESVICDTNSSNPAVREYCKTARPLTGNVIVRKIVQGGERLGEGEPDGGQVDGKVATVEQEVFNGLSDTGQFVPPGNYMVSLQAKTTDEWGVDVSRPQEIQISLDPLKILDVSITGLNGLSTGYASIGMYLTEAATVHLEVHKPGTTFSSLYTPYDSEYFDPSLPNPGAGYIGNRPKPVQENTLVYSSAEMFPSRQTVSMKWDGRCRIDPNQGAPARGASGCRANGEPLPDGNYVYVMWAEIPYKSEGGQATKYLRGDCALFDALRTVNYSTGRLPLERGKVDVVIQPVGYSTVGSTPVAYGLDPFIFKYQLSREAPVTANIKTADGQVTVYTLVQNEVQMASQPNTLSWNGLDNSGRYVAPGTYMFEITTRDPLFPNDPDNFYTQSTLFPVDLFRVVDLADTDLGEEANARASISYTLTKPMNTALMIFNKDIVIPTRKTGETQVPWPVVCSDTDILSTPMTSLDCIYDSDTARTPASSYPSVRLDPQSTLGVPPAIVPIKVFNNMTGAVKRTETWDGYVGTFGSVVPDGRYPFAISAVSQEPGSQYYAVDNTYDIENYENIGGLLTLNPPAAVDHINASDKPTGFVTVARQSVRLSDLSVTATNPGLVNTSEVISIPTYTVQFKVSRTAQVSVEIVATGPGGCGEGMPGGIGTVCRYLTKSVGSTTANDFQIFDGGEVQKVFWDGKNESGHYVKSGATFAVHFRANGYPVQVTGTDYETNEFITYTVNMFQIYDVLITDITQRGEEAFIEYQTSLPFKIGIQIFKPGTRIDVRTVGSGATQRSRVVLIDPATGNPANSDQEVLVKSIVGIRPHLLPLKEKWDAKDYAFQDVPDGIYPFRFVSAMNALNIDSVTGAIVCANPDPDTECQEYVADWKNYSNLGMINVGRGDSQFVCEDWESANIFYPNPFRSSEGTFEITKIPVPGEYSLKIFNLAGDLVRTKGYACKDRANNTITLNDSVRIEPDQMVDWYNSQSNMPTTEVNQRNAELKCVWDKKNDAGKKVARGVYFAIADFKATHGGREHCQKVVKILIP